MHETAAKVFAALALVQGLLIFVPVLVGYYGRKYEEACLISLAALVAGCLICCLLCWLFAPQRQPGANRRAQPQLERVVDSPDFYESRPIAELVTRSLRILPAPESFKSSDNRTDRSKTECAVCLEELSNGELVQSFPNCRHQFHASCISSWLYTGKITCPVCRCSLEHLLIIA